MSRYQAYAEYKDSGEEWLGAVPAHWEVIQIKHLSPIKRGASPRPIDDPKYFDDEGEYAWTRIADVTASDVYLMQAPQRLSALGSSLSIKLEPESLFLSIAGTVGKPCLTGIKACIHDGFVYFPDLKIPNKFLFYVFAGEQAYKGLGKFGTQLNLNTDTVGGIKIGCTDNLELEKIVQFLDHETAKIDTLIAKQQGLIKLLKEKRQAVISHAVTKGLNPNAPMRDSGVEWLGEVPVHWVVAPLKYVCKLIDGDRSSTYPNEADLVDEGIPFVSSKNITNFKLTKKNLNYITLEKFASLGRGKLKAGDLVITVRGTIGNVGIFEPTVIGCDTGFINAQMMIMRPNIGLTLFLQIITESSYWNDQLDVAAYGSTVKQLSNEILGNVIIALPPMEEIHEFVNVFQKRIADFEHLISQAQIAIELMQERRTALISAAVTGKIDVRDWQLVTLPELEEAAA